MRALSFFCWLQAIAVWGCIFNIGAAHASADWIERLPKSVELRPMGKALYIQGRPTWVWLLHSKLEAAALVAIFRELLEGDVIVTESGQQLFISRLRTEGLDVVNIKPQSGYLTGYVAISKPVQAERLWPIPEWIPSDVRVLSSVHSQEKGWHHSQWVIQGPGMAESLEKDLLSGLARFGWRNTRGVNVKSGSTVVHLFHPLNQGEITMVVIDGAAQANAVVKIRRRAALPGDWK